MGTTTMVDTEPRAWVGCLGCYNAGRLTGSWMSPDDAEEVGAPCKRCGSDEWWCFDVEGVPVVREMSPAEFVKVGRLAEEVAEHPNTDALRVWMAYDFHYNVEQRDYDADDIVSAFEEVYDGEHDSYAEYAYEWADNHLGHFDTLDTVLVIDWEQTGRNLSELVLRDGDTGPMYFFRMV